MSRYDRDNEPEDLGSGPVPRAQHTDNGREVVGLSGQRAGSGHQEQPDKHELRDPDIREFSKRHRSKRLDHEHPHNYRLRDSEVQTLVDLGRFRIINQNDLVAYGYAGDSDQVRLDLNHLLQQGLIQQRIVYPEREVYLTLSPTGHDYIQAHRPQTISDNQEFHRGFLKKAEARHDATLYRVFKEEAEHIRQAGGHVTRVVLDFELKKSINRELSKIHSLPENEQESRRQQIAEEHGLTVVNGKIPLPDLRLEYETQDREQAKVDIELVSGDYRQGQLASKARAGFRMYASAENRARLRPALADPELMQEILSL